MGGNKQTETKDKKIDNGQLLLTVDPTSRLRGRPTKTTQRNSDRINIWSQVPRWARRQDILTD
jgi:hypothetical protein